MPSAIVGKSATATLSGQNQNIETVHHIVASILGRAGCDKCGRLALLRVEFLGDPGPDLQKQGVISLHTEGF
ncbi:MAG: hypothetical protein LAO55_02935 [Acidobacteriia bacterium]|jgi:hypothetical protein|nr:hypothetical protein [Terriglobia bacterium]